MNHIALSAAPRQRAGLTILMGQVHRTLVLLDANFTSRVANPERYRRNTMLRYRFNGSPPFAGLSHPAWWMMSSAHLKLQAIEVEVILDGGFGDAVPKHSVQTATSFPYPEYLLDAAPHANGMMRGTA